MEIKQIRLDDRAQVRAFLGLPARLYSGTEQWVPPMQAEARQMLEARKNPFFRHSEAGFWLAMKNGEAAGRLAVLDHRPYNEYNHERTAFFYLFECEDNPQAAQGLFEAGFAWAKGRGMERMLGPKGFTPFDGMGLLVKGFEHRPAFGIPYNLPYYPALIEAAGFAATGEIVSGHLDPAIEFPERFHQLAARVMERRGLRIVQFKRRKDLQMLVPKLQELYNLSIEGTPGNYPVRDEDVKAIADTLLRFADPKLIKIILKGEQIVGFLFAYPDISAALQRTGGKLFPLGWARMLLEMRRTEWVNINGMGILQEYRGLGGPAILFSEMQKSISGGQFKHADLVQMGSDNDRMLRELRDLGVEYYKVHRMYSKEIDI